MRTILMVVTDATVRDAIDKPELPRLSTIGLITAELAQESMLPHYLVADAVAAEELELSLWLSVVEELTSLSKDTLQPLMSEESPFATVATAVDI
jgi:hypothetical protein